VLVVLKFRFPLQVAQLFNYETLSFIAVTTTFHADYWQRNDGVGESTGFT
jgi:hypothetical protein